MMGIACWLMREDHMRQIMNGGEEEGRVDMRTFWKLLKLLSPINRQ